MFIPRFCFIPTSLLSTCEFARSALAMARMFTDIPNSMFLLFKVMNDDQSVLCNTSCNREAPHLGESVRGGRSEPPPQKRFGNETNAQTQNEMKKITDPVLEMEILKLLELNVYVLCLRDEGPDARERRGEF
eukprot:3998265-Amphidinium_carterae.1